ncbi:MAG: hypothetical protein ABR536_01755 [Solirubrobacterales bacterium]
MKRSQLIVLACATALLASTAVAAAQVYGPAHPTRAEYVASAEGICTANMKKVNKLVTAANKKTRNGDFKGGGAKIIKAARVFGKSVKALAVLARPPADTVLLGRWVKSLTVDADLFKRLGKALRAGDAAKLTKIAKASRKHAKRTNAIVAGFGFSSCLINR